MYELEFLQALGITLLVETIIILIIIHYVYRIDDNVILLKVILFGSLFGSIATLPYVWFVFPAFIKNYYVSVSVSEIFVIITEAYLFHFLFSLSLRRSIILSISANAGSIIIGEILRMIIK